CSRHLEVNPAPHPAYPPPSKQNTQQGWCVLETEKKKLTRRRHATRTTQRADRCFPQERLRLLEITATLRAATEKMSVSLSQARERMISGYGMLAIEDPAPPAAATKAAGEAIATELTGELTPSGSACDGEEEDDSEGELTRTLSALQRLSVEDHTTLRRKLGAEKQQSSRCLDDNNRSSSNQPEGAGGGGTKDGEQGMAALGVPADSPFRVVLQKAVVESDLEAATAALRSGADPNERDDLCHSSLHFAAAKGDIGCLRELMQSGARANVANNVGWSPLHYAVLGGHVSAVEALLRAGAYPCFRDNHLISPLHLASTQAGEKETFRRIAELLGPSALLARDE
ncbi:unnamed protein product, partial [Ectocarpus fasciculatus]